MIRRCTTAVVAVFALVSCDDPTGVAESEGVRVESHASGLTIHNRSDSNIYYFAIDQAAAAFTEWVGCGMVPVSGPEECQPPIRPNESEDVAASHVSGWGESARINVYWWHLVPTGDGMFRADSLRVLTVDR